MAEDTVLLVGVTACITHRCVIFDRNDNKYTFENLEPGTIYEITITTVFRVNGSDLYSRPATLDDVATSKTYLVCCLFSVWFLSSFIQSTIIV